MAGFFLTPAHPKKRRAYIYVYKITFHIYNYEKFKRNPIEFMQKHRLKIIPITLREANTFVERFHRHNKKTQGHKFSVGAVYGEELVGVAIVGRPVARKLDDGFTTEITRVCVKDEAPKNTCSFLYGRCWRIWQQMGGLRMITYTLQSESGASLRASDWKILGETKNWNPGKGWTTRADREWQPVHSEKKYRWEKNVI